MSEARSRRMFFALWPDEEARQRLSALAEDLAAGAGGRLTRPESLHLTLAFLGAVAPAQAARLEQVAAGVRAEAFGLSLDRLGLWPQRGILWAGCRQESAPLSRLADSLATGLRAGGMAIDRRPGSAFVPHITLARRVRCASLPRLAAPIGWQVGEFALVESCLEASAARYLTLARFPLDDADGVCN